MYIRMLWFCFVIFILIVEGDIINGVFEFDFIVMSGGDECISNFYVFCVCYVYFIYKNWLVG